MSEIAAYFVASDEFVATYGEATNAEFVELVYGNVLCRQSDAGGKAYWLNLLNTEINRARLVLLFSDSPEFRTTTATE